MECTVIVHFRYVVAGEVEKDHEANLIEYSHGEDPELKAIELYKGSGKLPFKTEIL